MFDKTVLGLDEARRALEAMIAAASQEPDRPVAFAVADPDGNLILYAHMDHAGHLPRDMAARKAYTSARMGANTGAWGARMGKAGIDLGDLGDPRYTGFAGGVCVRVGGAVVGGIGVSGRAADEDEVLAQIGASAITG